MASNNNRDFIESHGKSKKVAKNISKGKKTSSSGTLDEIKKSKSELLKQRTEQRKTREKEYQEMIDRMRDSLGKSRNPKKVDDKTLQRDLLAYLDIVQKKINQTSDQKTICVFLLDEKKIIEAKRIKANIKKDGYYKIYYHRIITEILNPLYNSIKFELESKTKLADLKQVDVAENSSKTKYIQEQSLNKIIDAVEKEKVEKFSESVSNSKLPDRFVQIECDANREEILNYFMILSKEKNSSNGEIYMKEIDVIEFVKNNFSIFNSTPTHKYFPINLVIKRTLTYFIFQFFIKYDRASANTKMKYVKLLINNFAIYKTSKPTSIISNMSESRHPAKKNTIKIDNYF